MRVAGEDDLVEFLRLLLDRAYNVRMAMAVSHDPPGCDRVDDAAAIGRIEIGPVRALDLDHFGLQRVLREWMPDRRLLPERHRPKSAELNDAAKAARSVSFVSGESRGSRPNRGTFPISQIARSLSGLLSPTKAIPKSS